MTILTLWLAPSALLLMARAINALSQPSKRGGEGAAEGAGYSIHNEGIDHD